MIKYWPRSNVGKKGFISACTLQSLRKAWSSSWNLEARAEEDPGRVLLTGLPSRACSACFLNTTQDHLPRVSTTVVGWVILHQSLINISHRHARERSVRRRQFFNWGSLFPGDLSLCQFTKLGNRFDPLYETNSKTEANTKTKQKHRDQWNVDVKSPSQNIILYIWVII